MYLKELEKIVDREAEKLIAALQSNESYSALEYCVPISTSYHEYKDKQEKEDMYLWWDECNLGTKRIISNIKDGTKLFEKFTPYKNLHLIDKLEIVHCFEDFLYGFDDYRRLYQSPA